MALSSGAKKIVFYDLNPNNINFKKDLYSKWNGKNYQEFAQAWAIERGLDIEPELDSAQQEAELRSEHNLQVLSNWDKIKKLDIEFHCLNVVDNIDLLLKDNKNFFIHTSTILNSFVITNIKYSTDEINAVRGKIEYYCNLNNGYWNEST